MDGIVAWMNRIRSAQKNGPPIVAGGPSECASIWSRADIARFGQKLILPASVRS